MRLSVDFQTFWRFLAWSHVLLLLFLITTAECRHAQKPHRHRRHLSCTQVCGATFENEFFTIFDELYEKLAVFPIPHSIIETPEAFANYCELADDFFDCKAECGGSDEAGAPLTDWFAINFLCRDHQAEAEAIQPCLSNSSQPETSIMQCQAVADRYHLQVGHLGNVERHEAVKCFYQMCLMEFRIHSIRQTCHSPLADPTIVFIQKYHSESAFNDAIEEKAETPAICQRLIRMGHRHTPGSAPLRPLRAAEEVMMREMRSAILIATPKDDLNRLGGLDLA